MQAACPVVGTHELFLTGLEIDRRIQTLAIQSVHEIMVNNLADKQYIVNS